MKNNFVVKSILMLMIVIMAGCSSDNETTIGVDGTEKEVMDLIGSLRVVNSQVEFFPDNRIQNPFIVGDCDGIVITVKNFDGNIEEYRDGCKIQGKYRNIKNVPNSNGIGGMHYYELTISQIEKYVLPEEGTRSEDDILPCVILEDKSV